MPARSDTSSNRAVPDVVVERVVSALESRRTARDLHAFEAAETRIRRRRRAQIEIDVVGDEKIQEAIAIVVEKRAAGAPARAILLQSRGVGHLIEPLAVAIVKQPVLTEVRDRQIVMSVVVVVARARALAPSPLFVQARGGGHVLEVPPVAVAIEMRTRLLARWKALEGRAVDEEQIRTSVSVVIEHGHAASRRLEQVAVGLFAAERRDCGQAGRWLPHLRTRRELAPAPRRSSRRAARQETRGGYFA